MYRRAFFALAILLFFTATLWAQNGNREDRDTVRIVSVQVDPNPVNPVVFSVPVTVYLTDSITAASLGHYYNSDDIRIDSISLTGGVAEHTLPYNYVDTTTHLAAVGFIWMYGIPGLHPAPPGEGYLASLWFTLRAGAPDQEITIDSGFYPPAGDYILTDQSGSSVIPEFIGGTITVGQGFPPEPIIGLNPTSFEFSGVVGGANPQSKVLNVTNVGDGTLNWTSSWKSSWLSVYPASGTAPSNPAVSVNIYGMSAGIYYDTITVNAPGATNSPQKVPVTLNLINPPPIIKLVPNNFYFIAVQDGTNPANQQMTINDIGGGSLEWTATNSSSWLTLSSYSGDPGAIIDLMVNITGMSYGNYYDTIVVSDPEASNSPQRAAVELELVSSFPVLKVSPLSFKVPGSPSEDPPPRILKIINGGGGALNYSITSHKPWMTFVPQSGSTPDTQEVAVTFHSTGLELGYNRDTIIVTSNNGSESPKRIPVILWVMDNPPALGVSVSQLNFSGIECYNDPHIAPQTFQITNGGLDDMNWTASWDAPWMNVTPTSGLNVSTLTVTVSEDGLEVGTYVDTIWIDAVWSITPPQMVEVVFNVMETPIQPQLVVTPTDIEFIFLAGYVGVAYNESITVMNGVSGCIDWNITDSYPWLGFLPASGNDSTKVRTYVNGGGLPFGTTPGHFYVHSPGSINDSILVNFNVYITQIGDADCSGRINASDAVYLINYIFLGGPTPIPRVWTGDVNCDYICNVEDYVYLINYFFLGGPRPCHYKPIGLDEVEEMTPAIEQIIN